MPEKSIDPQKALGMCPHGNFLGACQLCDKDTKQSDEDASRVEGQTSQERRGEGPQRIYGFGRGVDWVVGRIHELRKIKERLIIAVAGKSGSGKTELSHVLREKLKSAHVSVTIVTMDNLKAGALEEPDAEKVQDALARLQRGETTTEQAPAEVVIIEGVFSDEEHIGQRPDMHAYIQLPTDRRFAIKASRDERVGYRSVKDFLRLFVERAAEDPEAIAKFEQEPDLSKVDVIIENDYVDTQNPEFYIAGDRIVFAVGGNVQETFPITDEQHTALEKFGVAVRRERMLFQEREPFGDERGQFDKFIEHIDKGERRKPTPEERKEMDQRLSVLGKLFEGSGLHWQLDGATNISLMRGDYIGVHKDVDISVEADEIDRLDLHLESKGYGLFIATLKDPNDPNGKRVMERVDAQRFRLALKKDSATEHATIAAVDVKGAIRQGVGLDFIDVHVVRRVDGHPVGKHNVQLPEKWFTPIPHQFQGTELSLSHPAKVAYFKLRETRSYDIKDLELLAKAGHLTKEDLSEIRALIFEEKKIADERTEVTVRRILGKITSDMSEEQIFDQFINDEEIAPRADTARAKELLHSFAEKIARETDRSHGAIMPLIEKGIGSKEYYRGTVERMDQLARLVT